MLKILYRSFNVTQFGINWFSTNLMYMRVAGNIKFVIMKKYIN